MARGLLRGWTFLADLAHHAGHGNEARSHPATADAYYARFGNFPPVLYWRGTVKGFQALMMQALERGTPLTADELMEVQGHKPSPEARHDARTG